MLCLHALRPAPRPGCLRGDLDQLRDAQNILWRNLPPTQSQPDEAVVRALRDIVRSARVKSVLERGSDTALVFVLRATNKVLADESQTPREIITSLWNILDEPELDRALGIPQNSRMKIGRKKRPAR